MANTAAGPAPAVDEPDSPVIYYGAFSSLVLWAACAFAGILGFSRLSYGLLLPSIRADLPATYSSFGLVGTANFAGYLAGVLAVPLILTRYPQRARLNFLALIMMGGLMIVSAVSLDLWQLGFWRFLIGFSSALATVLTMALTLERVRPAQRGQASGLLWMGGSAGIVISGLIAPPIISSGASFAWRLVWVAMGAASLLAAFVLHHKIAGTHNVNPASAPAPAASEAVQGTFAGAMLNLFRPRGLLYLTLGYFAYGFGYIIFSIFFIPLLAQQGLPQLATGLVWAAMGVASVVGGLVWGRAVDRWPNGYTMAVSLALGVAGTLGVATQNIILQVIGTAMMGVSLIGPPSIVSVLLKRAVEAHQYTSSFSYLTAIFAFGQLLGPLAGGVVVDILGLVAGLVMTAIMLGLAALLSAAYGAVQSRTNSPARTVR